MKAKILTSILVGILVISFISAGLAIAANGNGAGLERVPVLIGFKQVPGPSEQALVRAHGGAIKYSYTLVPAIAASIPEPAIEGLRRNPNVTIVEPDIEVYAVDAELDNSWGVKHIGAGTVHNNGNRGTGIKVAIIDSGVDYTHPDLEANFDSANLGYDFVNGDSNPMDDNGHGTHCAGIVAAEDDSLGVVGVAPEADLYALKVLNRSGSGDYSDVIAALNWCVSGPDGIPGNGDDPGIKVTSNSYGSSGYPGSTVEAAFINAAAAGIINVCAAGNNGAGDDTVIYPAKWYTSCIAVAATDSSDIRASFSSTGPEVKISAPGVGIYSTYPRSRYVYMSGTSMACPHVSGVVALMIYAHVPDIRGTLVTTAKDLGVTGWDPQYGNGLVDAEAAVGGTTEPPIVPNNPPVADSQSVGTDEDTSVSIKLTASDTEGDSLTYHIVSGPSHGSLSGATPNVIYTPNINYYGSDSLSFKVNDGNSDSNPATVSIDIIAVNDPPVADAGLDQSAFVGETVIFNGTDSYDPDGNIVSYDWDFGDGTESNVETTTHVYTATGAYIVTLTVTDEVGLMGEDTTIITVQEVTEDKLMYAVLDEDLMTLIGRTVGKKNVFVRAVALVQIMDADGPVEGATVFGSWSGATSDVDSGVTDSFGKILISSDEVKNAKSGTTFTFTVDDVVKSGWIYDNADPSASKDVP